MKKFLILLLSCIAVFDAQAQTNYGFTNSNRIIEDQPANNLVDRENFNVHFQTTYIHQYKPSFNSPFEGLNSLKGSKEDQNSLTATLYLGARLWKGAEVYVNPEVAGGSGLSGALGMAGSSNGETFRVGDPAPTLYLGRAYLQQTFALNKKGENNYEQVESDLNQLSGYAPKNYLRFIIGKTCIADMFDLNEYSNSPRRQFMNWSLMNNGAWDFAANTRGYTLAFITEVKLSKMTYNFALAGLPKTANGQDINVNIAKALSINAEAIREIKINQRPGHIRLLGFYNMANMGNYKLALAGYQNDTPTITTNVYGNSKVGLGLNFDQELSNAVGIFARLGWNDGQNETWCFTEIDHTASLGVSINGKGWGRDNDDLGIAFVANGISKPHRDYLNSGGYGFMLGDGDSKMDYVPETIGELYYSFRPVDKKIWFTGDYQLCLNPGYNANRGPVNIFSVRLHVEL